jgi:hypothetical protein
MVVVANPSEGKLFGGGSPNRKGGRLSRAGDDGGSVGLAASRRPRRRVLMAATHSRQHPVLNSPRSNRARRRGDRFMDETTINEYARQLLEAHGDRAVAEAAQRAVASEQRNDKDEAKTWRHIEAALKVMRGPSAS